MVDIKSYIKTLFNKNKDENQAPDNANRQKVVSIRNWYEERYESTLVQRNLLAIFLCITIIGIIISVIAVTKISTSKKFDPFVIQIDDTTGSAKIVTPLTEDVLSRDDSLTRYFIKRYLSARESYNFVDFSSIAQKTVKLFSSTQVFWEYRSYINSKDNDPVAKYGQNNSTYITIKSWSKLEEKKYVVRFSIRETGGAMNIYNKIAIVQIDYVSMELTEDQREINPIGLQIVGYRVDDDDS